MASPKLRDMILEDLNISYNLIWNFVLYLKGRRTERFLYRTLIPTCKDDVYNNVPVPSTRASRELASHRNSSSVYLECGEYLDTGHEELLVVGLRDFLPVVQEMNNVVLANSKLTL